MILGQRHLDYLVAEWLEHYHTERPHQAKHNELLLARKPRWKKPKRAPPADNGLLIKMLRAAAGWVAQALLPQRGLSPVDL